MSAAAKQYPLPLPHLEAMEAEDFLTTASNREAVAWVERWPAWPSHCLALYGPSGSGKTHLLNVWLARSEGVTVTASSIAVWDVGSMVAANAIIAIDDAEQITGDPAREETLFHLYNRVRDAKGFLLLTAQHAPAQWTIGLADLRSRLASIPAVGIAAPDDELISALLIKQFSDRQVDISKDVVDYLLPRIERTPAAIRDIVAELDRLSLAEGRKISVVLARRAVENQTHSA